MAASNEALQQSLMQLSCIYRNKFLNFNDPDYDLTIAELNGNSVCSLHNRIQNLSTENQTQINGHIATCLTLLLCAVGEHDAEKYNVHLYGALALVTQILIPNPLLETSLDTWFLLKWASFSLIKINISQLVLLPHFEASNGLHYSETLELYNWWQANATKDPEYYCTIDSFYGFSVKLIPLLLQFHLLVYKVKVFQTACDEEINSLEAALHRSCTENISNYTTSHIDSNNSNNPTIATPYFNGIKSMHQLHISPEYSTLFYFSNCIQSASLLWFYTYLKPYDNIFFSHENLSVFLSSMINNLKSIGITTQASSGLLFSIYILGSVTMIPEHHKYLIKHLNLLKSKCLSNAEAVATALDYIWKLKAQNPFISVVECHTLVHQTGINVCLY